MARRHYTPEEANAELARLRELLPEIRAARTDLLRSSEVVRSAAPRDGGGREGAASWTALQSLRRGVEELNERGIVLRDAETGLVDFPSTREGREVYLCWRPDEDRVSWWHEVDAGFSGRKPL